MSTAIQPIDVEDDETLDSGLTVAVFVDPVESAKAAGLRYVTDDEPGIRRRKSGKGFSFLDPQGQAVKDPKVVERIKKLAIPPAWTDVWICPRANGHLQATGRDARGRKQYRYHADWRSVRDETKFGRMIAFGETLPRIRERVDQDLSLRGLPREKVVAAVVKLLETTLIRVGNPEYAKQNNSFGLTTLRNRHVDISGSTLHFEFRGKSGKDHEVEIHDRRLARIVRQVRDLPGQKLFQYLDEDGDRQSISSEDVNDYLRATTGEDFSAKDFRTWGGTVLALSALLELGPCETEKEAGQAVVEAIKQVSSSLGNRPAICRKFYVHPLVIESYLEGSLTQSLGIAKGGRPNSSDDDDPTGLGQLEGQVLKLLKGKSDG
ncbi:MAG TPA: DNA topoisomerase IB [Thermoanaerobaculia bacterium]|jgi:DNA topoisomerase-1|nr:DNA topoisomerase IB [Thermoanaerobaculia bacterium]